MKNFGFIGLGLIGGSIAKRLKEIYPNSYITVYNRSKDKVLPALEEGLVDELTAKIDDSFKKCQLIFLCTPVHYIIPLLKSLKNFVNDDCIITDVGSVKSSICKEAAQAGFSNNFIGGHPMAGSQRFGYSNSFASLLVDKAYILTPDKEVSPLKLHDLKELLENLGANVYITDPESHDKAVAAISHMPHLAIANLVTTIESNDNKDQLMKKFAGTGFIDTTRIGASSPEVWSQIAIDNRDYIADILEKYIENLEETYQFLRNGDEEKIFKLFSKSKKYRDSFDK